MNAKLIVLMGIKHCGKSTQGRLIAEKLNVPFYDTDEVLEDVNGASARTIYLTKGEAAFKEAERDACAVIVNKNAEMKEAVAGTESGSSGAGGMQKHIGGVVATGGGICNNAEALAVLRTNAVFVFLCADESLAAERIVRESVVAPDGTVSNLPAYIAKKNPHSIAEVRTFFHEFYVARVQLYAQLADVTVQMLNAPKQVNMQRIIDALSI